MLRIVFGRLRAFLLRLKGAHSGAKTSIGARLKTRNARGISLGNRVEVEHDVFFKLTGKHSRLQIGDFAFIGRGCEIDVSESVTIGAHTLVAPGVFITDHAHRRARASRLDEQGNENAAVVIGEDAWLGTGCTVLPGVTIGQGAIVGAGAVVTRSVEEYTIVAGVPARVVGRRE